MFWSLSSGFIVHILRQLPSEKGKLKKRAEAWSNCLSGDWMFLGAFMLLKSDQLICNQGVCSHITCNRMCFNWVILYSNLSLFKTFWWICLCHLACFFFFFYVENVCSSIHWKGINPHSFTGGITWNVKSIFCWLSLLPYLLFTQKFSYG